MNNLEFEKKCTIIKSTNSMIFKYLKFFKIYLQTIFIFIVILVLAQECNSYLKTKKCLKQLSAGEFSTLKIPIFLSIVAIGLTVI